MNTVGKLAVVILVFLLLGLAIILGIHYTAAGFQGWVKSPKAPSPAAVDAHIARLRTQSAIQPPPNDGCIDLGSPFGKQLYVFPNGRCIAVWLNSGKPTFDPKGGEVVITPPAPARSWHDFPNRTVLVPAWPPLNPGRYTVTPVAVSATGVEISIPGENAH